MQEYFEVRNQVDGENRCELCDKYLTGTLIICKFIEIYNKGL